MKDVKPSIDESLATDGEPKQLRPASLGSYTQLIALDLPFALARYGDGEWIAALGKVGTRTMYRDKVTAKLSQAIANSLSRPHRAPYWYTLCHCKYGKRFMERKYEPRVDQVLWHWPAAEPAEPWIKFFRTLRTKSIGIVGLPRLEGLATGGLLPGAHHLSVDGPNCYENRHEILDRLVAHQHEHDVEVMLFCCGLASVALMYSAWQLLRGEVTLLDCGSILDPYVGVESAGGHKRPQHREKVRQVKEVLCGN